MEDAIPLSEIRRWIKDHPYQGFKPIPHRSEKGNQIEWYWSDEGPTYAESVHVDGVWIGSLHRRMDTKEVVGVTIFLEAVK